MKPEVKTLLIAVSAWLMAILLAFAILYISCRYVTSEAWGQNYIQVEGQEKIELPSMTPAEIRELEARQKAQQPVVIKKEGPKTPTQPKIVIIKQMAPTPQPKVEISIENNYKRKTPYPYHFEQDEKGNLRKVRD